MARMDRAYDVVADELDQALIEKRRAAGWKLVGLEWQRPSTRATDDTAIDVPYGYRVAGDCRHLEEDNRETEVLRIVMKMIVADRGLTDTAAELNLRGYKTRMGAQWGPSDVFRLMPALVDSAPRIFGSREWAVERRASAG
jgi:hypothetical protein